MQKILTYTAGVIGAIVALDVFGFMAWIVSGQVPVDGFYIGAITANVLRALLF